MTQTIDNMVETSMIGKITEAYRKVVSFVEKYNNIYDDTIEEAYREGLIHEDTYNKLRDRQ